MDNSKETKEFDSNKKVAKNTEKIKTLISEAKIKAAIRILLELTAENEEIHNDFILLSARYVENEKHSISGDLTPGEIEIANNKIRADLIAKLDEHSDAINNLTSKNVHIHKKPMESVFKEEISLDNIECIYVYCHIGRTLIHSLYDLIVNTNFNSKPPLIKILMREPYSEDKERYSLIFFTIINDIERWQRKNIPVELRFYESFPNQRGIVCVYKDESRKSILSSYVWRPLEKTQAANYSIFIQDDFKNQNELVQGFLSNFKHLWGEHNLHTIIFDFDDTLVNTFEIQISVWTETIIYLFSNNEIEHKYCNEELIKNISKPDNLKAYIRKIFNKEQLSRPIFEALFPELPEDVDKKYWELIESMRFEKRQILTLKEAEPFKNVEEVLEYLKGKYQLVIISSTSESLIQAFLQKKKLLHYFSFILGKEGPILKWTEIQYKAKLMVKLSKMIGISLGRMVYVGDNDADYNSSKQLNINFIEARFKRSSSINYSSKDKPVFFTKYTVGEFSKMLDQIERKIKSNELELSTSYLKHFYCNEEDEDNKTNN
jgi:phosphoglycolate phosphatase-like HAD superfamily hydrolase